MMINRERLAEEFARQAEISSPSYREGEISQYLQERFLAMGAKVVMDDAAERVGSQSGNLIATFEASGKDSAPIMLSAHMDTVSPCEGVQPVLRDGVFYSEGETVLGSDDKSGIAEMIEAIEVVKEQNIPHGPIEVVITVCEEVGLVGAKHLDFSMIQSRKGLALDTSGVDIAIHRAPCANKMTFEVTGREAHAGIAPENGLSAIAVASLAISKMKLGRVDADTTANIGTISGGQAINIVPRTVKIAGEARSHNEEKLAAQTEHMVACFEEAAAEMERSVGGETIRPVIRHEIDADYPLMAVPKESEIVTLLEKASAALGRPIEIGTAGGGSDANVFNKHGIETLILGTGMTHVHTVDESVSVEDMARVSELLVEVIRLA